jgi:hypothetical protein
VSASLDRLASVADARPVAAIVEGLGLADHRGRDARAPVARRPLDPPGRLVLRDVHRAGEHLFMHYAAAA